MAAVRKRIVIAIAAMLVIGVGAYVVFVFSGPKRGTVEWHKREYLDARRAEGKWFEFAPGSVQQWYFRRQVNRMAFHWDALSRSGYLKSRDFVVSKATSEYVEAEVRRRWLLGRDRHGWLVRVERSETNTVRVTAEPGAMDQLARWVSEADVAKAAK